jgi:DNA repair ATPase RecN
MEKDTIPQQNVEFVVMRTAQLPNQQGVQVNYTVLIGDSAEVLNDRAKRCEAHMLKIRSLHIIEVLEDKMQQMIVLVSSEADNLEDLQGKVKAGTRLNENHKAALANLPKQLEKHKTEMKLLEKEINRHKDIAKDLL